MLPFVRPILAFLIAPLSTSALLFTIGLFRGSESYYFDQLVIIVQISYAAAVLLGVPCYFFFRKRDINKYLTYAIWGGAIGGVPPLAILAPCALSPKSCGVVGIGFLSLLALGILFGMLSAIVFRIILGKHSMPT
jgi:hypothetical protein